TSFRRVQFEHVSRVRCCRTRRWDYWDTGCVSSCPSRACRSSGKTGTRARPASFSCYQSRCSALPYCEPCHRTRVYAQIPERENLFRKAREPHSIPLRRRLTQQRSWPSSSYCRVLKESEIRCRARVGKSPRRSKE